MLSQSILENAFFCISTTLLRIMSLPLTVVSSNHALNDGWWTDVNADAGPWSLYQGGCASGQLAEADADCSIACINSHTAFASLATFRNCIVAPAISFALSLPSALPSDVLLASTFRIDGNATVSYAITETVLACVNASCESIPSCSSGVVQDMSDAPGGPGGSNYSMLVYAVGDSMWNICNTLRPIVNSDIGGIGVCVTEPNVEAHRITLLFRSFYHTAFKSGSPSPALYFWVS